MKKKLTLLFALLCASVMGWAELVTYTGAGFSGAINSYTYDIGYSITYDDDHHLTFNVTLDGTFQETDGFVFEVWSTDLSTGNFKSLVHGEGNAWSVTDDKDYQSMEGQSLSQLRLRLASSQGGTDQLYLSDYTVGLSGAAATSGPSSRATTPTAPSDKVKAIYSWYYAKGCNFADWGGSTSSQNMRYGKKLSCTRPEGNGWLGLVDFGDLDCSAMDKFHMDIWVENDASMRLTPIHYGFGEEYRHVINLTGGQWNSIELDLNAETFVSDASVGAPNDYWDVINQFKIDLLANGLDFWIDNVYFYSNQSPVFTSISITGPTICKVGQNIPFTIETLDQFGQHIDAEFTCSVSPVSAGTVVGTTYTPSAKGAATITATSGLISNSLNVYNYEGDNLALNKLESQSTEFSGYGAARAVDGIDGTEWQGSPTNGTAEDKASRTYDCWFSVDLGGGVDAKYDIDLVTIHFEGACSDAYKLYGSTDNSAWTEMYSWEYLDPQNGNRTNNHTDLITSSNLTNNSNVRYIKFLSTRAASQWGVKIFEFQVFGSESNTLTKSVSASVNDPAMGTATVKQNDVEVTEVTTGSTVTFSATPKDGYIFVDWSNGNTNATFNATVDAAMNLTANFRALGNIYCNTLVHSSNGGQEHDAYVTMKRTAENEYQLIVRAEYELGNFSNTEFRIKALDAENTSNYNLNNNGVLSNGNHTLTGTIVSTIEPEMISAKLYVNIVGKYEGQFDRLTNIEYGVPCDDESAEVESIALDMTEATIEIGATKTLIPTLTPVYAIDKTVTWTSSKDEVATVTSEGVVEGVAVGSATITATCNGKTATCEVTVAAISAKTWWGTQTITDWDPDMDVMWSVTRNANKTLTYTVYFGGDASDKVKQINNGEWHALAGYTDANRTASYTTETTYEAGTQIKPDHYFYFGGPRIELADAYVVGSENERPATAVASVEVSSASASLLPTENLQLIATVLPSFVENKNVNWSSDNTEVATVSNTGLVTAVAAGTAHITATSVADGTKSATCTVTVVSSITSATWYGYSTIKPQEGLTAYTYSITRGTDHKLTFTMTTDKNVVGYVSGIEGDVVGTFGGYDAVSHTGTFTTTETYTDGAELHLRLTFASASYGAPAYDFTYTVGSENAPLPQAMAVDETKDNTDILTAYDGQEVIGVLGRSFVAGKLYTLVLPFDVDAAQTAEKLPGSLTKLQNTIVKENGDLRINFVDVDVVEAGVPYLYTPSADVNNPVFIGVTVHKELVLTEPDSYAKYYGIYAPMDGSQLHGITNGYVLGSDQYLYTTSSLVETQVMNALRGYFVLNFPTGGGASGAPRAKVVFNSHETETTTGIEDVQGDNVQCTKVIRDGQLLIIKDNRTYNAQGQLIK